LPASSEYADVVLNHSDFFITPDFAAAFCGRAGVATVEREIACS